MCSRPVVLSNLSVAASASFAQHVLGDAPAEAAGGSPGHPPLLARDRYRSFRLPAGLNTEIYDFSQQLIIVDTHSVVATDDDATPGSLVRQLLALESIGATALKADSSVYLTERFWATAFDYPVSLDDMAPDEADAELGLIEIGYRGGEAGRLLTFYGAAQRSELMARVMAHYQRYRAACESSGVRLQIEIKEVDEIDYGLDDFGFEEADFLDDDQEGR